MSYGKRKWKDRKDVEGKNTPRLHVATMEDETQTERERQKIEKQRGTTYFKITGRG